MIIAYLVCAVAIVPLALWARPLASVFFTAVFAFAYKSFTPLLDAVTTIRIGPAGNYGRIRAFGSISFIVMVLFLQWTPFLRPYTPPAIAFWTAIPALVAIIPTAFLPSGVRGRGGSAKQGAGRIWTGRFIIGLAVIFLSRLAATPINSFVPIFLTEVMKWNVVGAMFALAAASEVPFMFLSSFLIKRYRAFPLLALSAAAIGLRLLLYAFFPCRGSIIAAQCLNSVSYGIFHPAAIAFITHSIPPERRALGMTIYLSLGTGLPTLIGNVLGGAIVEHAGYFWLFSSFSLFGFAGLGIFFLVRGRAGKMWRLSF
jgi:PPP family 3-phenylpropionic acid transporter